MYTYVLLLENAAHLEIPLDKPPNTAFWRLYQSSVLLVWEIFPEWVISFPFNRKLFSRTLLNNKKETLKILNRTCCCQLVFLISSICTTSFYECGWHILPISTFTDCVPIKNLWFVCNFYCTYLLAIHHYRLLYLLICLVLLGFQLLEDKNYVLQFYDFSRVEYITLQMFVAIYYSATLWGYVTVINHHHTLLLQRAVASVHHWSCKSDDVWGRCIDDSLCKRWCCRGNKRVKRRFNIITW